MINLKNLLNELTFASQDAFNRYNERHKLRDSTKVTINGKKMTVSQAEKKDKKKKDSKKKKNKADYAENSEFWEDKFKPGDTIRDEDGDAVELDNEHLTTYRLGKIGMALADTYENKQKEFGYNFNAVGDDTMSVDIDDGPYRLGAWSTNNDGSFKFGFAAKDSEDLVFEDFSDSGYIGGRDGVSDPKKAFESMRYILNQPETVQFLKGKMTPREYKKVYERLKREIQSDLSKKESMLKLGSILKEIKKEAEETDKIHEVGTAKISDKILNQKIKYKDLKGKEHEVLVKTALTYKGSKEYGQNKAYQAAIELINGIKKSGDEKPNIGKPSAEKPEKPLSKYDDAPDGSTKPWQSGKDEKPKGQKVASDDLKTSAEKGGKNDEPGVDINKLKSLMPGAKFDRKPLSAVTPIERQKISMKIDDLAKAGAEAKAKGEKAPNYNLCQVTVPGTNLYCDGNKGIPRAEMPQFKGTPEKDSPADKLPKDENGEADTEEFFKQMLEKEGIKVSEPTAVPPDRLKATQSELVGVKVAGMSKVLDDPSHPAYEKITAPIYVSNDGYVLDGHHRWAAVVAHNAANPDRQIPMNVRVIDEPIEPLVKRSNKFAEDIGIRAKAADTGAGGGPQPIVGAEKKK